MSWHARLSLDYRVEGGRCIARHEHEGPLRILQSLYPEGDSICHNVLVHPPSGLVGGDTLELRVHGRAGTHGLITTPGASRFYRSDAGPALQHTRIVLEPGARLEWLPLEAICYSGCIAQNRLELQLAGDAQLLGWDVAALGLPAAGRAFESGSLLQHLELDGAWLERGLIEASDTALMDGPLGLAGHRCIATLFAACGEDFDRAQRELLLEAARECIAAHGLAATAGATAPGPRVVVVRVMAPLVEPALDLLKRIRAKWRSTLWSLPDSPPRGWAL